jgi:hypothetical protein
MRNTKAIIEAICNYTSFDPVIKTGLTYLKESEVDIVHWNALNEQEEQNVLKSDEIKGAFNRFSSSVTGSIVKETKPEGFNKWVPNLTNNPMFSTPQTDSQKTKDAVQADREKYKAKPGSWEEKVKHLDKFQMTQAEISADVKKSANNTYYEILSQTEKKVGKENIKNYIEKISDDVQNFVSLVTYLTDQIVKEAWVNAPQTIQKVSGNRLYFLEQAAMEIRGNNVNAFMKEAKTLLNVAFDLSNYFVLQNANDDIKKSVEEVWPEVKRLAKEKIDAIKAPEPVRTMFAFNETIMDNFKSQLSDAVWESIPTLIENHGDSFFLIIESEQIMPIHDAFNSSRFQAYHPIFESMYYELKDKKPFNWLLELETYLIDDKEIEKNLTYCATTLVRQQLAKNADLTFPTIGKVSGFTAHKLAQDAYRAEDGLSEILGVKDSLWITSGYVPGTFGLILLFFNVASAVLFVAYAEDVVGFDMDKSYPEMANLPIWKSFKESAFDLKVEYQQKRKEETKDLKVGTTSPRSAAKTGIKIK